MSRLSIIDSVRSQSLRAKLAETILFFFIGPSVFATLFTIFAIGIDDRGADILIFSIIASVPVAGLVAWFIASYFVSPLYPLRDAVRQMSSGDLEQRAEIMQKDEIGEIGIAFNTMAESLGSLFNELQEDTVELTVLYEAGATLSRSVRSAELKPLVADVVQHSLDPAMTILVVFDENAFIYRQKGFTVLSEEQVKETMDALSLIAHKDRKPVNMQDSDSFSFLPDFGGVIVVPISVTERIIGAIAVFGKEGEVFADRQMRFIETIGYHTSTALHRASLYEELEELAIRDDLTGLFNFRYLHSRLDLELAEARLKKTPLSLIILDLDYFKDVNDTYGHMAGDEILRQIADVMTTAVRGQDIVARYGGEEFVVILPEADEPSARLVAERILTAVAGREFDLTEGRKAEAGSITVSLGIAASSLHGENKEELIRRADLALYEAKRSGRNAVSTAGDLKES